MAHKQQTKEQLVEEINRLQKQIAELEKADAERQQTEETLRQSEERYRILVEAMNDGLVVVDENMQIKFVNNKFCTMLGYTYNELIGRSATDLHDEENKRILMGEFAKRRKGEYDTYEIAFTCKNGQQLFATISPRALLDVQGHFTGSFSVITDITLRVQLEKELKKHQEQLEQLVQKRTADLVTTTEHLKIEIGERKQTERALRDSEERFKAISAAAQDAIIMMDNEGNISYWNEAAQRMFGYSQEEATGKNMHTFLAPERYHGAYKKGFSTFKETGQGPAVGKTLELSAIRKDGTEFQIELSLSAVQTKGKWNSIGILRDITKRKETEKQLKKKIHDLEVFHKAAVDRELKMKGLKAQIAELEEELKKRS